MKRIAEFNTVSPARFAADFADSFGTEIAVPALPALPRRATSGSAGYDFYLPCPLTLAPGQSVKIPTGMRVRIDEGWVLKIYPRSGLGFKFRLQLNNTVGIIDSDYYYSDNEGHILIKLTNDSRENKTVELPAGAAFAQGVFVEYGITVDDCVDTVRNGGLGSTGGV
ncbi:MAG: deoxyuridine 5'-triphosphate nucleotidohydrolase [Clostridia bacterium]|jgi:dUTP pyrophosphatase|nr:deoxyuridine 5'-triphosphate nucleotidohydrolase [Clostridia bacterium]